MGFTAIIKKNKHFKFNAVKRVRTGISYLFLHFFLITSYKLISITLGHLTTHQSFLSSAVPAS